MHVILCVYRVKDLTNAKDKLEAQVNEMEETNSVLKKKISGLVSIEGLLISCLGYITILFTGEEFGLDC